MKHHLKRLALGALGMAVGVVCALSFGLADQSTEVQAFSAARNTNNTLTTLSWSRRFDNFSWQPGAWDAARNNGRIARDPAISIRYRTYIEAKRPGQTSFSRISCGTSNSPTVVPYGTIVRYVFDDHKYTDFSWSTSGGTWDTPYGIWRTSSFNPAPSNSEFNARKAVVGTKFQGGGVADGVFVATEPVKSMRGGASSASCRNIGALYACDQTMTNTNGITARFFFGGVPIRLMGTTYWPGTSPGYVPDTKLNGPTLAAPSGYNDCYIKADEQPNQAPSAPTFITAPQCQYQTDGTYRVTVPVRITDPDSGEQVAAQVEWISGVITTSNPGSSGSTFNLQRDWTTPGTKTFQVRSIDERGATSGWVSGTATCEAPPPEPEPPSITACSGSPSSVLIGSPVTWTGTVSGGQTPYTYSWSGSDGLSGTSNSVSKVYTTIGTKNATLTVTDANSNTASRPCSSVAVRSPLAITSCYASPSSVEVDTSVTWRGNVSGGQTPYTYSWSGSDGLSGTSNSVSKTYTSAGTKSGILNVTDSGGVTASRVCTGVAVSELPPPPPPETCDVDLSLSSPRVRRGDSVTLSWNVCSETCTLSQPGSSPLTVTGPTGSQDFIIEGTTVFRLQCPSGVDLERVDAIATSQET